MYSEQSESRENAQARGAPYTRVSFRVLLSRDFSRLPQMESLLTGYLESFIFLFFFHQKRLRGYKGGETLSQSQNDKTCDR